MGDERDAQVRPASSLCVSFEIPAWYFSPFELRLCHLQPLGAAVTAAAQPRSVSMNNSRTKRWNISSSQEVAVKLGVVALTVLCNLEATWQREDRNYRWETKTQHIVMIEHFCKFGSVSKCTEWVCFFISDWCYGVGGALFTKMLNHFRMMQLPSGKSSIGKVANRFDQLFKSLYSMKYKSICRVGGRKLGPWKCSDDPQKWFL